MGRSLAVGAGRIGQRLHLVQAVDEVGIFVIFQHHLAARMRRFSERRVGMARLALHCAAGPDLVEIGDFALDHFLAHRILEAAALLLHQQHDVGAIEVVERNLDLRGHGSTLPFCSIVMM
jgi:hypothetical protein